MIYGKIILDLLNEEGGREIISLLAIAIIENAKEPASISDKENFNYFVFALSYALSNCKAEDKEFINSTINKMLTMVFVTPE